MSKIEKIINEPTQSIEIGNSPVDWSMIHTAKELIQTITVPNSGDIMTTSDELTDAKIAASEARTDTKIVRIEGKLDLLLSESKATREDIKESKRTTWTVGLTIAGIIVSVIIGIITMLPSFFDMGKNFQNAVINAAHQTHSKK